MINDLLFQAVNAATPKTAHLLEVSRTTLHDLQDAETQLQHEVEILRGKMHSIANRKDEVKAAIEKHRAELSAGADHLHALCEKASSQITATESAIASLKATVQNHVVGHQAQVSAIDVTIVQEVEIVEHRLAAEKHRLQGTALSLAGEYKKHEHHLSQIDSPLFDHYSLELGQATNVLEIALTSEAVAKIGADVKQAAGHLEQAQHQFVNAQNQAISSFEAHAQATMASTEADVKQLFGEKLAHDLQELDAAIKNVEAIIVSAEHIVENVRVILDGAVETASFGILEIIGCFNSLKELFTMAAH